MADFYRSGRGQHRLAQADSYEMSQRGLKTFWILSAFALTAALAVVFFWDPATHSFYPRCMLHQATGFYCPGCGILRATHELLHGNIESAFRLNSMFVLSLPVVLAYGLSRWLQSPKRRESQLAPNVKWVWVAAFVMIAFGVVRNLPYSTLAWMRP
jgi:hypothetical protein